MSDDLLHRASEALRTTTDGASDRAEETRARLLAESRPVPRTRTRSVVFLLPIAAALAVSSAWAAATGRLATTWQAVEAWTEPVPSARSQSRVAVQSVVRSLASANPVQEPAASASPEPEAAPSASVSKAIPSASGSQSAIAVSSSAPPDAGDADHAAYLSAHRTHFSGGDPGAALAAWDSYLRAFPAGRFSLEARYNRALCLVRLGRKAEASQALEPFARGSYGKYRQTEAQALRDALGN